MALANGAYIHYMDMKKLFKKKKKSSPNRWLDFEIISKKCSLNDISEKLLAKL